MAQILGQGICYDKFLHRIVHYARRNQSCNYYGIYDAQTGAYSEMYASEIVQKYIIIKHGECVLKGTRHDVPLYAKFYFYKYGNNIFVSPEVKSIGYLPESVMREEWKKMNIDEFVSKYNVIDNFDQCVSKNSSDSTIYNYIFDFFGQLYKVWNPELKDNIQEFDVEGFYNIYDIDIEKVIIKNCTNELTKEINKHIIDDLSDQYFGHIAKIEENKLR